MTQDWWKVRKGKILANNFIFDCIICMAASPKKNGAHLRTQILNTTGTPTPNQQQSLVLGSDLDSVMAQCSQQLGTVLCPSGQLEGHNQLLRRSRRKFPDLEGEDSLPCYSKSGGNHHQMVNHFANRSPPSVPKRARLATPASSQAKDISNRFQESCGGSSAVIDDAHAMYHSSLSNHIQEHISCQLEVSITHLSQTPNSQAKKRSVENAGNLKTFSDGSSPETGSLDVLQPYHGEATKIGFNRSSSSRCLFWGCWGFKEQTFEGLQVTGEYDRRASKHWVLPEQYWSPSCCRVKCVRIPVQEKTSSWLGVVSCAPCSWIWQRTGPLRATICWKGLSCRWEPRSSATLQSSLLPSAVLHATASSTIQISKSR